jgi:predicted nucleic acid-binding Zn ribbon protein
MIQFSEMRYRDTNVTRTETLPVLLSCALGQHDGLVTLSPGFGGTRGVSVVPYSAFDLFQKDSRKFQEKYGSVPAAEDKRLRALIHVAQSVVRGTPPDTAQCRSLVTASSQLLQLVQFKSIRDNPARFLAKEMTWRAAATLVAWRRGKGRPVPGFLCPNAVSGLYALALFHIAFGAVLNFGLCVICGKSFKRLRGERKQTCSEKCRTEKSRRGRTPKRVIHVKRRSRRKK